MRLCVFCIYIMNIICCYKLNPCLLTHTKKCLINSCLCTDSMVGLVSWVPT